MGRLVRPVSAQGRLVPPIPRRQEDLLRWAEQVTRLLTEPRVLVSPPTTVGDAFTVDPQYDVMLLNSTAARTSDTSVAIKSGIDGQSVTLINTGAYTLTLKHGANTGFRASLDYPLYSKRAVTFWWSSGGPYWRDPHSRPSEADFALTDITTANATTGLHGLLPKLSGNITDVLQGDGTWGTIEDLLGTKARITVEGGLAVKLVNRTGSASVKGELVRPDDNYDDAVELVPIDAPDIIGVFYESDIADGASAWIVVAGIADVYYIGSTTRGQFARMCVAADTSAANGRAIAEARPTSPFATDKHFQEIGYVLQSRTGAGLARTAIHFN